MKRTVTILPATTTKAPHSGETLLFFKGIEALLSFLIAARAFTLHKPETPLCLDHAGVHKNRKELAMLDTYKTRINVVTRQICADIDRALKQPSAAETI